MALLPEVEELLKDYPADAQKVLREFYDKNPDVQNQLKAQALGQRDLSRKYQEVGRKEKEAEAEKTKYEQLYAKNVQWFKDSEDDQAALEEENKRLKAEVEAAKKERAAAGREGAPPAEIAHHDEKISALETQLKETRKILEESEKKVAARFDSGGMFLVKVNDLADQYQAEFGQTMPGGRTAFIDFMSKNNLVDPDKAYELFTSESKTKKLIADEVDKERKKWDAEQAAKQVPYATGSSSFVERGPLQHFIQREEAAPKSVSEATAAAAAELMKEGKG